MKCDIYNMGFPDTFEDYKKLGIPRTRDEMRWAVETGYIIPSLRNVKNGVPSVEQLLDVVDLELKWYIPSIHAFDFMNFIRLCVGGEPENLNSMSQYFFVDSMLGCIDEIRPYFQVRGINIDDMLIDTLIISTREFSKSTLVNYFILYMADKGKIPRSKGKTINYGLYISDKMKNGNVTITMNKLETFVKTSDYLRSRFESYHFTDSKFHVVRKPTTPTEIAVYNKAKKRGLRDDEVPNRGNRFFTVDGLGSSGGRGASNFLFRPQFAIFDDLIGNEKDSYSEPYLEGVESTIESDVGKSMSKSGYFNIFVGTIFHTGDPLYRRASSGYHLPIVFPAAEVPPHGGVYDKDGAMIEPPMTKERFISVWGDRHSFEAQRIDFKKAEIALKNNNPKPMRKTMQEFFLRVVSENERLIPADNIQWENVDYIRKNAHLYTWILATDLTTTGNSESDDSGAFMWAIDYKDDLHLVDMVLRKMHLNEQSANIFDMIAKVLSYGVSHVETAVEIDGQQSLHIINLEKYANDNNLYNMLYFATQRAVSGKKVTHVGIRSHGHGDKLWRLKPMAEKYFNQKKVFFNKEYRTGSADMSTYLNELRLVTFSKIESMTDNGLDASSILMLTDYSIPSNDIEETIEANRYYTEEEYIEESIYGSKLKDDNEYNIYSYYYGG